MSVTVADIMKLPCLKDAKVVAGAGGMSKVLSSVTVLEFSDPNDVQREILSNIDFYGSEMVITAFANIPDNVEQQCANIKRLASVGEAGMILYYVGILMPRVDPALIELANQLDFVLIVMPEKRWDLRYSEVITEVMEAIVKDQTLEISLLTDVLDHIGRLPEHQRTVDAVLRMVRDRTRTSLVLVDRQGRALGQANWPISLELQTDDLSGIEPMLPTHLPGNRTVWRWPLSLSNPQSMELYLVKDGNPLSKELVLQMVELIRLAVSLWSSNHAEVQISELVRAILLDEPLKMRRLADLFHIDVASIHSMWVLHLENADSTLRQRFEAEALTQLREALSHRCSTVFAEMYEGYLVGFMSWKDKGENVTALSDELIGRLAEKEIRATLIRCHSLRNTADVRRAFLLIDEHLEDAKIIWPTRQNYSLEEIEFVAQCRQTVNEGEEILKKAIKPLQLLDDFSEGAELLHTLSVYLLDVHSSITRCAELLYLHKNTVKYRLGRIGACLGHHVDKEPEKFYLYRAAVLNRLLEKNQ
ncbi:MAG: PucR family transcriptional regulator ligand-binding domain-containing protein [Oscillospiraceae bacterium]|nr:PucR family transcriptional regulator ligand-binding domain-containing protein [Oscillospiraceae bacterium]